MSHYPQPYEGQAAVPSFSAEPRPEVVVGAGRQTVWWLLTVLLAIIATALVVRREEWAGSRSALAQVPGAGLAAGAGGRGIYAFSGQLTAKTYGVWMLDVDTGTIWCYELGRGANDELQMRLVSARSWIFDRYLEEFNVGEPIPAAVRGMVQQLRSAAPGGQGAGGPKSSSSAPALPDDNGR